MEKRRREEEVRRVRHICIISFMDRQASNPTRKLRAETWKSATMICPSVGPEMTGVDDQVQCRISAPILGRRSVSDFADGGSTACSVNISVRGRSDIPCILLNGRKGCEGGFVMKHVDIGRKG
jgi:hypothetical protein